MDPGGKIYTIDEFRCWKVENLDDEGSPTLPPPPPPPENYFSKGRNIHLNFGIL